MKRTLLLPAIFAMAACAEDYDASKLKPGMSAAQVLDAVGDPGRVMPLLDGYEIWRYEEDHVVLMENGRVLNVGKMTAGEYERTLKGIDQAKSTDRAQATPTAH